MMVRVRKLAFIGLMALAAVGVMQGSASAAADGDLDISTLPPQAQWRINQAQVVKVNPGSVQIDQGAFQLKGR